MLMQWRCHCLFFLSGMYVYKACLPGGIIIISQTDTDTEQFQNGYGSRLRLLSQEKWMTAKRWILRSHERTTRRRRKVAFEQKFRRLQDATV